MLLLIVFAATLLCSPARVDAVFGPELAASATDFPQIAVISYPGSNHRLTAAIISRRFVVTNSFLSSSDTINALAYSGDLSNFNNVVTHSLQAVSKMAINDTSGNSYYFSVAKLCPPIGGVLSPVSLRDADQFDYQTNTTGKIIYFKPDVRALYYRTTDIMPGAACAIQNLVTPRRFNFFHEPYMVCAPYDSSPGSCKQQCYADPTSFKCFPLVLVNDKSAAISYESIECLPDASGSFTVNQITPFFKMSSLKTKLLTFGFANLV